jgi:membrane protease YdiL (CAAX protease family)
MLPIEVHMKVLLPLAVIVYTLLGPSQSSAQVELSSDKSGLYLWTGLSALPYNSFYLYTALAPETVPGWASTALLGTSHLALYAYDPEEALAFSGASLALGGLALANQVTLSDQTASYLLVNSFDKLQMFSTYEVYMKARERLDPSLYAAPLRHYSLNDLLAAPFKAEDVLHLPVIATIGAIGAWTALSFATMDQSESVWSTGSWHWGQKKFSPWIGIPLFAGISIAGSLATGVGEEALYRGVYYEEMKDSLGKIPAKFLDAAYFSAVHIPQEIAGKAPSDSILLDFAIRSVSAFFAQWCYDSGNLRWAVAAHTWGDVCARMAFYLNHSGSD